MQGGFLIYLHGIQSISEKTFLQNTGGYGKINAEHLFYDYNLAHMFAVDELRANPDNYTIEKESNHV